MIARFGAGRISWGEGFLDPSDVERGLDHQHHNDHQRHNDDQHHNDDQRHNENQHHEHQIIMMTHDHDNHGHDQVLETQMRTIMTSR